MNEHIETVIIGAGQAGLSTGYHLKRRGRPFVILDGNARVGDNWRQQWGHAASLHPGEVQRAPRDAVPGQGLVLPAEG
jgi:putative flavoprotein involved in K+ transport